MITTIIAGMYCVVESDHHKAVQSITIAHTSKASWSRGMILA